MRPALKFVFTAILAFASVAHAVPPIEWASHLYGANFQQAGIVAISPAGNVYFTGYAGAGAVFGTNSWTAGREINWFLAKHDAAGRLLWVQSSTRIYGESIAFDSAENAYLCGQFTDRSTFGDFVLTASNQVHTFLVKFEPDGDIPWARAISKTDSENSPRVAVGPTGDVYLASARVRDGADEDEPDIELNRYDATGKPLWPQPRVITGPFGGNLHDLKVDSAGDAYVAGNISKSGVDTADYFVTKFNADGNRLWTVTAYGTDEDDNKSELAIDSQGFVYIAGDFNVQTAWGTNILTDSVHDGVFLAKLNPAGDVLWARGFHGRLNDFDQDAEGNCFLVGDFNGTLTLGTNLLTSRGSSDFYVARFDRYGTPLWVRQAGGAGWDHSPAVSLDQNGNVFMSGFFFDPIDFGPQQLTSRGFTDLFIARYNRHGKFFWAQQFGGANYEYQGSSSEVPDRDWAIDAAGNIYFSAEFWSSVIVGTITFNSSGNTDVFFAKLAADPPETLRFLTPIYYHGAAPPLVQIGLAGTQGRVPIHIQSSTDLKTWTPIYTQAVPAQVITVLQPPSDAPARFYRALIP